MQYRSLGQTGVKVSPLCLGTLNFGGATPAAEAQRLIHRALDSGVNFIDTANIYNDGESERIVGKALNGGKREKVILATKVHFPLSEDPNDRGNSRLHILKALEGSLRRLQVETIDLYQIHRPSFDIPQEETLQALDDLVRQGKVRYIGTSTHPAWLVMEGLCLSQRHGWSRYASEQPPYNLLDRRVENELIPLAQRYNLAILPWSPLATGQLAGRYASVESPPEDSRMARVGSFIAERITRRGIQVGQQVAELAREWDLTASQLSLLWLKDQPGVTAPIIGPRTEAHLVDALAIMERDVPAEAALVMEELVPPGSAVANYHNNSGWMRMQLSEVG